MDLKYILTLGFTCHHTQASEVLPRYVICVPTIAYLWPAFLICLAKDDTSHQIANIEFMLYKNYPAGLRLRRSHRISYKHYLNLLLLLCEHIFGKFKVYIRAQVQSLFSYSNFIANPQLHINIPAVMHFSQIVIKPGVFTLSLLKVGTTEKKGISPGSPWQFVINIKIYFIFVCF